MRHDAALHLNRSTTLVGVLFLLPAMVFIIFAFIIPAVWNLILSFQEWDGFQTQKWVSWANYLKAFQDPKVFNSLYNSIFLAVISTAIAVILGVILAALVYKVGRREGGFYRLILFIPVMLPLAIIGLLFSFMYNPEMGVINQFLKLIGAGSLAQAWLDNPKTVMFCISLVGGWRMFGLTLMLCFAAMQMIPVSIFESSKIDGAGYLRQVFTIVIPLIKPIILLSAVYTLIVNFKTYDLVFVMTRGGPGTISQTVPILMSNTAFTFNEFGYSATMGVLLTLVVTAVLGITSWLLRGESNEY